LGSGGGGMVVMVVVVVASYRLSGTAEPTKV
jgi:hypothetical protein